MTPISKRQQEIANRHTLEVQAMSAHASPEDREVSEIKAAAMRVRLMVHDRLSQGQIDQLASELSGMDDRQQLAFLIDLWDDLDLAGVPTNL